MKKNEKFILVLLLCTLRVAGILFWLRQYSTMPFHTNVILKQTMYALYYLTPVVAVWITDRGSFGKLLRNYRITFRGIDVRKSLIYLFGAAFLVPLLSFLTVFIVGNVLQIEIFGHIGIPVEGTHFMGFVIPSGVILRFIVPYLYIAVFSLLWGSTINMISEVGGEVGWRGFLGNNLQSGYWKRNVVTGLIWGTWWLPMILISRIGQPSILYYIVISYMTFIAYSFLLDEVFRGSRSLFISAAVRGIVMATTSTCLLLVSGNMTYKFDLANIVSIVLITLLFRLLPKRQLLDSDVVK